MKKIKDTEYILEDDTEISDVSKDENIENPERELLGDENYESFFMPDGSINEKFLQKVKELPNFLDDAEDVVIPFSKFPSSIKNLILKRICGIFIFLTVGILGLYLELTGIQFLIITICISLCLAFSCVIKYFSVSSGNYVEFRGLIVDVKTIGIMKANRYQVVKISNEEKFLNIKVDYTQDLMPGVPITVYLRKDEKIVESEYGPLAEHFISFELSVLEGDDIDLFKNQEVTAKDYIE